MEYFIKRGNYDIFEINEALVTTVLFDNEVELLHDRLPIADVKPMTEKEYWVRGCTALLDAVGTTVNHISRVHGYLPEEVRPEHTIVVITTDGMENASRTYRHDTVKKLISKKEAEGWNFLFLGANIDAVAEAERIGIAPEFAATYLADEMGTEVMHRANRAATVAMRAGAPMPAGSWKLEIEQDLAKRGRAWVGSAPSAVAQVAQVGAGRVGPGARSLPEAVLRVRHVGLLEVGHLVGRELEVDRVRLLDVHRNPSDQCVVGRHIAPVLEDMFKGLEEEAARELRSQTLADCIAALRAHAEQANDLEGITP